MTASPVPSDLDIAQAATLAPISEIAATLNIPDDVLVPYGRTKAKVPLDWLNERGPRDGAKLILVTGITPTPAGEGKTTTTVGLGDALRRIGQDALICLREPSLGPCFGVKGGAAGGGYAQVVPMEEINLHFTGDFHAITSAHNLLSAMLDNHIHWGNAVGIDPRRIQWRRVVDLNDRALRDIVQSLGGPGNGYPRQDGFDITVASEIMAILCLARDLEDLQQRLGDIVIGETSDRRFVRARELEAAGAMTALLKDALSPNLVQTLEKTPALVHGGPFANIAHGCNSVAATRAGLTMGDYVVTEAGFGSDLGAEKFFDIKCRAAGLEPDAVVIVATIRALKMHGGVPRDALGSENLDALKAGVPNLLRHAGIISKFGITPTVALNRFTADTDAEVALVREACAAQGVEVIECTHWANGGAGAEGLARAVVAKCEAGEANFDVLYPDDMSLKDKIATVSREIYGAGATTFSGPAEQRLKAFEDAGFASLPVCMAKTPLSLSADPSLRGAPEGHEVHVREVRLSAGAGFVVAICGSILTMPGLPRVPAANAITVNDAGAIEGLF